jgi:hypothetical protein
MEKMGMVSGKFLWAAKHKALWGIVFGLMTALPGVSGAQQFMTVKMTSAFSTVNGSTSVKTDYASLIVRSPEVGVEQNQYLNKVLGTGGTTTVIAEFATSGNSGIDLAGLTILKDSGAKGTGTILNALPGEKESAGMLQALEKIGTGNTSLSGSFGAAGGSEIRVTETDHSTTASTKGGGLYYLVESSGVGMIKAGVVSEVCVECVPPPTETVKKGDIDLLRLNPEQIGKSQDPGSQIASMNVEYNGQYKGFFEGIIARPK